MSRHRKIFETRKQPVISKTAFTWRVSKYFLTASSLIGLSLFAGMLGYRYLEKMSWIDAFANASMILSGMGPLIPMQTWEGKLFAGLYALYSGLILILASGLLLAPMMHRLLHSFHYESENSPVE